MTPSAVFIAYALASWIFLIGRDQPAELPERPAPKVHVVHDTTRAP